MLTLAEHRFDQMGSWTKNNLKKTKKLGFLKKLFYSFKA